MLNQITIRQAQGIKKRRFPEMEITPGVPFLGVEIPKFP